MRTSWLILLALVVACSDPAGRSAEFGGATMGTYYRVRAVGLPPGIMTGEIEAGVRDAVTRVDELMSTYKEASELSRFNRAEPGAWFPVARETAEVIALALSVHHLSDSSFDVTVGPLVNLWGFGPDPSTDVVPPEGEIARALAEIGSERLAVREGASPALRKEGPLYVDLSAIAKGYAVDLVAQYLESEGIRRYLVDIGGEMRVGEGKPDGEPWNIAIQVPGVVREEPGRVLPVTRTGIATSGDYRNYFEVDGVRYSHTIDPRTGYPIRHNLASVTVFDPRAARADALATALNVMGLERGMELAEREGIAVLFIAHEGEGFREYRSSAMAQLLDDAP